MRIAIGNDHAGLSLKSDIIHFLEQREHTVKDVGTYSEDSCDYPDFAIEVCQSLQQKDSDLGILICGTGIGMSIAANKHTGIRAALVHTTFCAQATREHNNSNVLCLGARVLDKELALEIVKTWIETTFQGGRHQRRINKIEKIADPKIPTSVHPQS